MYPCSVLASFLPCLLPRSPAVGWWDGWLPLATEGALIVQRGKLFERPSHPTSPPPSRCCLLLLPLKLFERPSHPTLLRPPAVVSSFSSSPFCFLALPRRYAGRARDIKNVPHRVIEEAIGVGAGAGGAGGGNGTSLRGTVDEIELLRTKLEATTAVRSLAEAFFWLERRRNTKPCF